MPNYSPMLGLRVTTYTHCLPPPLLILDFSSHSSSIFVCLMSLPDGITDILNPECSVSVSMPFSNQDCCACPFVIIIGKKGPRDAQIDHLGARLIPLCPTVRWQPYYLMTGQLPCQNIDPSSELEIYVINIFIQHMQDLTHCILSSTHTNTLMLCYLLE